MGPLPQHLVNAPAIPECVHCGFCLPVCPTYDVLGTEMDNPRGRLYLMRALEEGRIGATESVVRHLDLCLGCRACETECPSGVPYGHHLGKAREALHGSTQRPIGQRILESAILFAVALPPFLQRWGAVILPFASRAAALLLRSAGRDKDMPGATGTSKNPLTQASDEKTTEPGAISTASGLHLQSLDCATNRSGATAAAMRFPSQSPGRTPSRHGAGAAGTSLALSPSGGQPKRRGAVATSLSLLASLPHRAASLPRLTPALTARKLRVGFLEGCVNRWVFGHVNEAAARLLAASGCDVVSPRSQRCCGALHAHAGDREGARALAKRNIAAFEAAGQFEAAGELDAIVVAAAGCGSAMKEYATLFEGDAQWHPRALRFASKVKDALELMAEIGLPAPVRAVAAKVAYHDACHLAHAQQIRAQPRALLAAIPQLELVSLADADRCCGSAGIYNVLHPEEASQILASKLDRIAASGATIVTAANPGCLLQVAAGARAAGLPVRVVHPIELLDEASRMG